MIVATINKPVQIIKDMLMGIAVKGLRIFIAGRTKLIRIPQHITNARLKPDE